MTVQPRLLFVDDDAMIGRLFERLVSRLGYAVDIASGFPDALRRSALHEYDVHWAPDIGILPSLGVIVGTLLVVTLTSLRATRKAGPSS